MTARTATHTIVSSATREVVIGFDRPFTIIGERINPTGRKLLAEEMRAGDFSRVERDVIAQVEAGAHMLDVNAGIPLADEPAILARNFERLVVRGLGLDRHPELLPVYFGNYRRLVYLAQTKDPALDHLAAAAATRLGLAYERRFTGLGALAAGVDAFAAAPEAA